MRNSFNKIASLLCAVCLISAAMCGSAMAEEANSSAETDYKNIQIYVDDLLDCRGVIIDGTTYVTFKSVCNAIGQTAEENWTETDKAPAEFKAEVDGITVTYTKGAEYLCANGRYLYFPGGSREIDGETLFPVRVLAKIFGLGVEYDHETTSVSIDTEKMALIESGDSFYNADDASLLSHIVYAEAGNQPLSGKIGVGAVVMNRVASPVFPNTIKEVIYAPGQFDPVRNGSISLTPNSESVVAAYLAIEGYNTVGDSVFFHNPGSSTGYLGDPTFVVKIQDHVFFKR